MDLEWKIPQWSNAIERDRARIYFVAYAAGMALHFLDKAFEEVRAGRTKTFEDFDVPDEAIGCGFHEAVRGVLSHHLVIRDGKIANYHPYPPTPWNGSPTDSYGTPGPYEDAVNGQPIFEENGQDSFRGIDIMRAVRVVRPVPAVRRAHVPRRRQDDQAGALADVRRALGDVVMDDASRPRIDALLGRGRGARRTRARARWRSSSSRPLLELLRRGARRGSPRAGASCRWTTSWWRTCCCCTGCIPCRSRAGPGALDEVRPYLRRPRRRRRAARASRTASCACGCEGAATAARRRR